MSSPDDALELVVVPSPASGELVVLGERGVAAPPSAQALAAWSVGLVDGMVEIGGVQVHPVVARELLHRLQVVVGQAEHDAERDAWCRLERELDRQFAGAMPAHGKAEDGSRVSGVLYRSSPRLALMRVATFAVAYLHPHARKARWEGPVHALRPTSTGHDRLPTGTRVRVSAEVVEASPAADELLGRPVLRLVDRQAPPASRPGPATWGPPPRMRPETAARQEAARQDRAGILDRLRASPATVEELAAGTGRLAEDLDELLRDLASWRRAARLPDGRWHALQEPVPRPLAPLRRDRSTAAVPRVEPPEAARARGAKARGKRRPSVVEAPPAPPRPPLRHCRCGTSRHTWLEACPDCGRPY